MADACRPGSADMVGTEAEEAGANAALAADQGAITGEAEALSKDARLVLLANALIRTGQLDQAERTALAVSDPEKALELFRSLSAQFAAAGEFERAEHFARKVRSHDPERLARTLAELAGWLAADGEFDWAERVAQTIAVPYHRATALGNIVASLAAAGAVEQADRVDKDAERATEKIVDPQHQ